MTSMNSVRSKLCLMDHRHNFWIVWFPKCNDESLFIFTMRRSLYQSLSKTPTKVDLVPPHVTCHICADSALTCENICWAFALDICILACEHVNMWQHDNMWDMTIWKHVRYDNMRTCAMWKYENMWDMQICYRSSVVFLSLTVVAKIVSSTKKQSFQNCSHKASCNQRDSFSMFFNEKKSMRHLWNCCDKSLLQKPYNKKYEGLK